MSYKKINLEEILDNEICGKDNLTFGHVFRAMKEACRQTLELAAENAEVIERNGRDANPECFVDIQSILDTIKQVE